MLWYLGRIEYLGYHRVMVEAIFITKFLSVYESIARTFHSDDISSVHWKQHGKWHLNLPPDPVKSPPSLPGFQERPGNPITVKTMHISPSSISFFLSEDKTEHGVLIPLQKCQIHRPRHLPGSLWVVKLYTAWRAETAFSYTTSITTMRK